MPLLTDSVHIWRSADGVHHVDWEATQPETEVTVEPLTPGGRVEIVTGQQAGARVTGLAQDSRHQFRLIDQHGNEAVASERRLGMEGTPNFRDFGGYPTSDGRQVKWGYLYRSGQLSALTEADVSLLASLELDLICDFRREDEQETEPSLLPESRPPRIASLPIIPGSNAGFFEEAGGEGWSGREPMFEFMVHINHDFAEGQTAAYARMFSEILALEDTRLLVHCAAGKDRTGFAAAIILLALGVSSDVVMNDYMLTREFFLPEDELDRLRTKYEMEHLEVEAILPMLEVHEDYLSRALSTIDEKFGGVEAYLRDALGVGEAEVAELKRRYVE
ncbi:MAG: tyrosine-protein phosphatase [Halieaceae bacterium]